MMTPSLKCVHQTAFATAGIIDIHENGNAFVVTFLPRQNCGAF
jgi:hypothetical protein